MKKINNYYILLMIGCGAFASAMDDKNAIKPRRFAESTGQKQATSVTENGKTAVVYNPKVIYKHPTEVSHYQLLKAEVERKEKAMQAQTTNALINASDKALDAHEKEKEIAYQKSLPTPKV